MRDESDFRCQVRADFAPHDLKPFGAGGGEAHEPEAGQRPEGGGLCCAWRAASVLTWHVCSTDSTPGSAEEDTLQAECSVLIATSQ